MSEARRGFDTVRAALGRFEGIAIDLVVGTPGFEPPRELLDALRASAGEAHYGYTDNQGTLALREAICRLHLAAGESLDPEQIFVSHGAKVAALGVLGCLLEAGDEVVLPSPCYPPYLELPRLFGARPVLCMREGPGFELDPSTLAAAITSKTRMLLVTSPCNPTGATLNADQAQALVDLCRERDLWLVVDETYASFVYGEAGVSSMQPFDPQLERTMRIRSFSKGFGLCGWRTGYVVAHAEIANRLAAFQASNINPPNALMQRALGAVDVVPPSYSDQVREFVRERLQAIVDALNAAGLPATMPTGGFYAMVDLRRTAFESSLEFCRSLAEQEGVGLWPGEDFQAPGWARVCGAALADLAVVAELEARVRRFLD